MLTLAGVLCFLLAAVHSILGERMIFQPLRMQKEHSAMRKYRGILWATWHLVTIFGACLGLYLLLRAGLKLPGDFPLFIAVNCLKLVQNFVTGLQIIKSVGNYVN